MAARLLQSRLDGSSPLRPVVSARSEPVEPSVDDAQDTDLFQQHSKYAAEHANGKAAWRKEWEVVWYKPGSTRLGKVINQGGSFFRHIVCGGEHSCKNMPRANIIHQCKRVSLLLWLIALPASFICIPESMVV